MTWSRTFQCLPLCCNLSKSQNRKLFIGSDLTQVEGPCGTWSLKVGFWEETCRGHLLHALFPLSRLNSQNSSPVGHISLWYRKTSSLLRFLQLRGVCLSTWKHSFQLQIQPNNDHLINYEMHLSTFSTSRNNFNVNLTCLKIIRYYKSSGFPVLLGKPSKITPI